MPKGRLYRITLPYACGGIVIERGVVTTTAPIFKWMRGKSLDVIERWVSGKGGTVTSDA